MSPAEGARHQRAARRLANLLEAAANAAGADVEVIEAINVRHSDERLTIPDIAVVDRAAAGKIRHTSCSDPRPCLHVQRLGGGSYEQVAAYLGGTEHAVNGPFPCTFDPADLIRQVIS